MGDKKKNGSKRKIEKSNEIKTWFQKDTINIDKTAKIDQEERERERKIDIEKRTITIDNTEDFKNLLKYEKLYNNGFKAQNVNYIGAHKLIKCIHYK